MNQSAIRIVLTYIRSAKYISRDELQEKVVLVSNALEISPPIVMDDLIEEINHQLHPIYFKIESNLNEVTGEMCYTMINARSSERDDKDAYKLFTNFKESEMLLVKSIIDSIFNNQYHYNIDSLINYNMRHGKSYKEISNVLTRLINQGWLERYKDEILVSVRLKSELKHYLTKFDVQNCCQCGNMVTLGVMMNNDAFHYRCFDIFKRTNEVGDVTTIGITLS